ncbi:MAG: DNA adenine methylase [Coriobacteriia bacterium]|nr:DNA adenine methylase [Coriobacteriia bacterium]
MLTTHKRLNVSPMRYPGGKGALYSRLRQLIRDSDLAGCTYVEPYAGGAGAGLSLLVTGQVKHVVINDLDPAIHAFWKYLTTSPDALASRIMTTPLTVKEWREQKHIYGSARSDEVEALGFATFYLNRTNRSGVLNGGPIGGHDQTGNYKIDARFNREQLVERVNRLALYANDITVTSSDGVDVIKEYSSVSDAFIYADPPYFEKAGSLYMNAFTIHDHERLAAVLNERAQSAWLLTYDNSPHVVRLYPDRRRETFELCYSANGASRAREVAVLSDAMADIPDGWALSLQ